MVQVGKAKDWQVRKFLEPIKALTPTSWEEGGADAPSKATPAQGLGMKGEARSPSAPPRYPSQLATQEASGGHEAGPSMQRS
ncbi:hypothetical protein VZT92_020247 [Zoarces viviparus]|uniref:Uncharacterized protein n=1 Tax=Zoarces viviparus TaxID=48416 RepID=A0AAW1ECD6_ZOAVI